MSRTECKNVNNFMVSNCNNRMRIRGGARFCFGGGGGGTANKISDMNSTQILYCNGVAKFRFGETFSKNVLIKDFCKILKNLFKNFNKNLKFFSKLKFNGIVKIFLKFKK